MGAIERSEPGGPGQAVKRTGLDPSSVRPDGFVYEALPAHVVFGWGASAARLAAELESFGAARVLAVYGEAERELAERLISPLGDRVIGAFTEIRPHVPLDVAEAARQRARDLGAEWLLSIGGGSTTGTAKAVALELGLPIAAVPTTYAGSEMTPVWGLTDNGHKKTGRSPKVLPRLVIYDPELTTSLPGTITAPSAFNALAHCVESFYAPGSNPITSLIAEEGIRALSAGVGPAVAEPAGREGREQIFYGAYLAGSAFAVAGSGLHHKICHVLGGRFDLPHAETHTVMLPQTLAFNEPAMPAIAERIRRAIGAAGQPAGSGAAAIYDLIESVGAPTSLAEVGMVEEGIDEVVDEIVEAIPADNPRLVSGGDVVAILHAALEGRRPAR